MGNVSSLLSIERGIGVDWGGTERSVVDGPFAFQGRWGTVAFDPLASASAGSESARVGWLDVLNKREKGMPKGFGNKTADSY